MKELQAIKQRYGIIGSSPLLERALSTALRVSNTDLTVLISGESGVGKEVFSKIIHDKSARKHNNFIAINCGAIPEGTINSELFGHEKGAFTGATNDRKGYFETYNGGTIFLDEIGEMPLDTQSFLLRVLENGEFIRVGSSQIRKTDVRIIAATNVDLKERISKGKFREDLFYRLNTVPIILPALRERREDLYLLFRKFIVDFAERYRSRPIQLDEKAQMLLENYSWPGNIRELKNMAEQISVMAETQVLSAEELLELAPTLIKRNLPALRDVDGNEKLQEREILYKLLFDMKGDLNDLKSLVFELIKDNDLQLGNHTGAKALRTPAFQAVDNDLFKKPSFDTEQDESDAEGPLHPIIIPNKSEEYQPVEEVEENLSLQDNEKELIKKALKKHKGKRKEAAKDLGISERTLYRKIKEYEILEK